MEVSRTKEMASDIAKMNPVDLQPQDKNESPITPSGVNI